MVSHSAPPGISIHFHPHPFFFFFFLSEAHKKIERWQPTHFRCFRMMSSPSSITSHVTWSGDHLYYIVVLLFIPLKVEVKTYTCVPGIGCRLVLISIKGASKCKEERSLLLNQPSWIKDEVQPTCPHHTTHMETCGWGHSLSFIQLGWSGVTAILILRKWEQHLVVQNNCSEEVIIAYTNAWP